MAQLAKLETKRMYQTSDGMKHDTYEKALYHSNILKFRKKIGLI
jgi:hypothetical protein